MPASSINHKRRGYSRPLTAAVFLTLVLTASVFSQEFLEAKIPVRVNVAATVLAQPSIGAAGEDASKSVAAGVWDTIVVKYGAGAARLTSSVSRGQERRVGQALVGRGRGVVSLTLPPQSYANAMVSLHSINGKRILGGRASASAGTFNISRPNVAPGVYLLSVKGTAGGSFTTKLTHGGGKLNISVAFANENMSLRKEAVYGETWTLTVSAPGYYPKTPTFTPKEGENEPIDVTLVARQGATNFTETVNGVSFDMVYIEGGSFTLGCGAVSDGCPPDTRTADAAVSPYFIGQTEVTRELWWAVMDSTLPAVMRTLDQRFCMDMNGREFCFTDTSARQNSVTTTTWYDAHAFACKLSELTGKNYRMMTEAEWEFAAKRPNNSGLSRMTSGEEWAYNTWSNSHTGGTDPVGPGGVIHNQKTRRGPSDANNPDYYLTARLIRSIEGRGPAMRLVVSATTDYPPSMINPCGLIAPFIDDSKTVNSYRDPRWVTGDDYEWSSGNTIVKIWEDGAMVTSMGTSSFGRTNSEWYTVNNFVLKTVPTSSSGSRTKSAYIFVSPSEVSVIAESGMITGRLMKRPSTTTIAKPSGHPNTPVRDLLQLPEDQMYDMSNPPTNQQDERLLDGPNEGWWQNNSAAGGTHNYRKDVTRDDFRFIVYQSGFNVLLAGGEWFTVNNAFLRVKFHGGHVGDYLYTVSGTTNPRFMHVSFMDYERGDMRQFTKTPNADVRGHTSEIPASSTVETGSFGQNGGMMAPYGVSTFKPAPCPPGGCN